MKVNELKLPQKVFEGSGAITKIEGCINKNDHVLLVSSSSQKKNSNLDKIEEIIMQAGATFDELMIPSGEPTQQAVQDLSDRVNTIKYSSVFGVGGGSALDIAKLLSLMYGNNGDLDMLINSPAAFTRRIPLALIPTTVGTGAEATANAIVTLNDKPLKHGIVNLSMIPDAVVLDPDFVIDLPEKICASTGADALCHAIECYTSLKATCFSDMFSLTALTLILPNLKNSESAEARAALQKGAFLAGAAITHSGTTAVHALSYPLGGEYHIPHGEANAMLLAPVIRFNMEGCRERLEKVFDCVYGCGKEDVKDKALYVVESIEGIIASLPIRKKLSDFGVEESELHQLSMEGIAVRRLMDNNCRDISIQQAEEIYRSVL